MAKLITKNEQSISWKELAEGVKAGEIALQQGDTVELKLTTGEIVFMQAVKVSEDGKRVTFVSKDCLATEMPMNEERTNYGGWAESDLRKRLNTEVFNTLPEDTRKVVLGTRYDEVQNRINATHGNNSAIYYTVQDRDTLSEIAEKYGTTYQKIASMNGIQNPNKIYAGQKIRVK